MYRTVTLCLILATGVLAGCNGKGYSRGRMGQQMANGPEVDRPFPVGAYTDPFWETQQTNAEAADFIFYDHEFVGNTAMLTPGAKKKLMSVALRLEHVPFPVVVEESLHNRRPQLDVDRRRTVVEQLAKLGVENVEGRVVIAPSFAEGFSAIEGQRAYIQTFGGGGGGGFGGGVR